MKVILLRDVAKMGRRFDVVDVPSGHAQNFLIPRGDAVPATPVHEKRVTELKRHHEQKNQVNAATLTAVMHALSGTTVTLAADTNATGGLFKGLKEEDIAAYLHEQSYALSASDIHIEAPIKHTGEYTVALGPTLGKNAATFTLVVISKHT